VGIIGFLKEYDHLRRLPVGEPLASAISYIQENLSWPLKVRGIAEATYLSVRQVERLFRSVLGVSPKAFIIKTRVHAAAEHLLTTDWPLSRIALETGFCDQSSLTYYFRRELGIPPNRFRKAGQIWSAHQPTEFVMEESPKTSLTGEQASPRT